MPCPLYRMLLLSVCGLAGCETFAPFTRSSDLHAAKFDMNDPQDQQRALELAEHFLLEGEIARTPPGSLVRVVDTDDRQFLGTLVRADQAEVQLLHPLCKEVASSRLGNGQLKLSHVPVQTIETTSITGFTTFSPPPADFDPKQLHQSRRDSTVQAIVLRSGRHLPWVDPPAPNSMQDVDANEASDRIAAALPGSHVCFIDESGQQVNGVVVSVEPEGVELMNCLIRERLPEADGPALFKTSHLPFQSFQPSSLKSFAIVAPPPPDYSVPEVGVDCEEYIVSEFVFESGRRQAWGLPANDARPIHSRLALTSKFGRR